MRGHFIVALAVAGRLPLDPKQAVYCASKADVKKHTEAYLRPLSRDERVVAYGYVFNFRSKEDAQTWLKAKAIPKYPDFFLAGTKMGKARMVSRKSHLTFTVPATADIISTHGITEPVSILDRGVRKTATPN